MERSLSGEEVRDLLDGRVRILSYGGLRDIPNINSLLHPYGCAVILYHTDINYGHWTCIFRNSHGIEFFDSYGYLVDNELKWCGGTKRPMFADAMNQDKRHLTRLLAATREPVHYNHYHLQKKSKPDDHPVVSTCGRWVVLRLWNKDMHTDEFVEELRKERIDKEPYDEIVLRLVPLAGE